MHNVSPQPWPPSWDFKYRLQYSLGSDRMRRSAVVLAWTATLWVLRTSRSTGSGKGVTTRFSSLVQESGAFMNESWTGTTLPWVHSEEARPVFYAVAQRSISADAPVPKYTGKRRKDGRGVWGRFPRLPKRGHLEWVLGIGTDHDGNRSGETRVHHTLAQSQTNDFRIICSFFWYVCACVLLCVCWWMCVHVFMCVSLCVSWVALYYSWQSPAKRKKKEESFDSGLLLFWGPGFRWVNNEGKWAIWFIRIDTICTHH